MLAHSMPVNRLLELAMAIYILYRSVNHIRHLPAAPTPQYVSQYMKQILHEATRGNSHVQLLFGGGAANHST